MDRPRYSAAVESSEPATGCPAAAGVRRVIFAHMAAQRKLGGDGVQAAPAAAAATRAVAPHDRVADLAGDVVGAGKQLAVEDDGGGATGADADVDEALHPAAGAEVVFAQAAGPVPVDDDGRIPERARQMSRHVHVLPAHVGGEQDAAVVDHARRADAQQRQQPRGTAPEDRGKTLREPGQELLRRLVRHGHFVPVYNAPVQIGQHKQQLAVDVRRARGIPHVLRERQRDARPAAALRRVRLVGFAHERRFEQPGNGGRHRGAAQAELLGHAGARNFPRLLDALQDIVLVALFDLLRQHFHDLYYYNETCPLAQPAK